MVFLGAVFLSLDSVIKMTRLNHPGLHRLPYHPAIFNSEREPSLPCNQQICGSRDDTLQAESWRQQIYGRLLPTYQYPFMQCDIWEVNLMFQYAMNQAHICTGFGSQWLNEADTPKVAQ